MNIKFAFTAWTLLLVLQVQANPISRKEARQVAQSFVAIDDASSDNVPNAPYYIFSRGAGKGFVIASGDDEVAPILRRCIQDMRPAIEDMSILKPFSFVLIDEDHETLQDLVFIDNEETMVLDGKLIDGLTDDLDDFLQHLLEED